jgi:glucose/arabinose dehydrogenase
MRFCLLLLLACDARPPDRSAPRAPAPVASAPIVIDAGSTDAALPPAGDDKLGPVPQDVVDHVQLVEVGKGFDRPVLVTFAPGDARLYVVEQRGKIRTIDHGKPSKAPFFTIDHLSKGAEEGLLGLAFHPDYARNHRLWVNYTSADKNTHIVEYRADADTVDPASAHELIEIDQPFSNHNGGNVVFGPDGKLYIGLSDGGSGGDPNRNGQNLGTFLGKILRIDPTPSGGQPYTVPADNPFVGRSGAKPEIWAYGLRNPWRFSFDRASGDLWIGDVGQDAWEEVDHAARGQGGQNYEWNLREASHPYNGGARPAGGVDPVYEYSHNGGNCSITGGYVYRGSRIGGLVGSYLFADFCVGRVFALTGGGARAMGGLSQRHQDLLIQRDVQGIGYAQLAAEMGVTPEGARAVLFRARRCLQQSLERIEASESDAA